MENTSDGNIEKLKEELENIYIRVGEAATMEEAYSILDEVEDRRWEIENILNPPLTRYELELPIECGCNSPHCWECVYKDDPMGI